MNTLPTIRIAMADDEMILRNAIAECINRMEGFDVCIQACNGRDLLEQIGNADLQPDVCLVDIGMPEMNGYETVLQLKQKYPFIHAMAFTVMGDEYCILKMLSNGAGGYLHKNVSLPTLQKAIMELYTTGFYCCDIVKQKCPGIAEDKVKHMAKQVLFTNRETEFLSLCCTPLSYADIGKRMNLSQRTVENYAAQLHERLNLHSRTELALYAQYTGIGSFRQAS